MILKTRKYSGMFWILVLPKLHRTMPVFKLQGFAFFDTVDLNSSNMGDKKRLYAALHLPYKQIVFRYTTILIRHSFVVHFLPASEPA
jgi:hypothetical protein